MLACRNCFGYLLHVIDPSPVPCGRAFLFSIFKLGRHTIALCNLCLDPCLYVRSQPGISAGRKFYRPRKSSRGPQSPQVRSGIFNAASGKVFVIKQSAHCPISARCVCKQRRRHKMKCAGYVAENMGAAFILSLKRGALVLTLSAPFPCRP